MQTRLIDPAETLGQALRAILLGKPYPGAQPCSEKVHASYTATGPDGKSYPSWHPPRDTATGCTFNHEHGSNPQSYAGFGESGWPLFGYTAAKAGFEEPHAGYKVYVTNADLNGHAWMILLNQDTFSPQRAVQQFHTVDWHISDLTGHTLVSLHLLGDFGYAAENCNSESYFAGSGGSPHSRPAIGQYRSVLSTNCVAQNTYESWVGAVSIQGIFEAAPLFDVENPATAVDPADPNAVIRTCDLLPLDQTCYSNGVPWLGNRRSVMHPGQWVTNSGPESFYTNGYGDTVSASDPGAIAQYVTQKGWDTRNCCGPEVVFRIQTYSRGVYIADPPEGAGSAEFDFTP